MNKWIVATALMASFLLHARVADAATVPVCGNGPCQTVGFAPPDIINTYYNTQANPATPLNNVWGVAPQANHLLIAMVSGQFPSMTAPTVTGWTNSTACSIPSEAGGADGMLTYTRTSSGTSVDNFSIANGHTGTTIFVAMVELAGATTGVYGCGAQMSSAAVIGNLPNIAPTAGSLCFMFSDQRGSTNPTDVLLPYGWIGGSISNIFGGRASVVGSKLATQTLAVAQSAGQVTWESGSITFGMVDFCVI